MPLLKKCEYYQYVQHIRNSIRHAYEFADKTAVAVAAQRRILLRQSQNGNSLEVKVAGEHRT